MKRPNIFYVLALQLLAFEISEGSLIARGRQRTKRPVEHTKEAPFVCLDTPAKLPACNFDAEEVDEETIEKRTSRQLRSLDSLTGLEDISPFRETGSNHRGTTIIYKIEGCLPSRLPFVVPLCKTEDSIGRIVEVRRLFPFKVASGQNSDALPTLIFPEVDLTQWHRFMEGPWIRPASNNKNEDQIHKETFSEEPNQESDSKKNTKHKKTIESKFAPTKTVPQKFTEGSSKGVDENDIFSKFPSPVAMENHLANDRQRDPDSYRTRSSRLNRIVSDISQDSNGEIFSQVVEKNKKPSRSLQQRHEFPFDDVISYDPEKLKTARPRSELPSARSIPYSKEDLESARLGSEFPFNHAISYDQEKLRIPRLQSHDPDDQTIPYNLKNLRVARESPFSRTIPFDEAKLHLAEKGTDFPDCQGIHYDTKNLRVVSPGSEFPYSKAITFDPVKLHVAKRGSEFPYTRAIAYDPKKLEERKFAILASLSSPKRSREAKDESLITSDRSAVVPFDARMLDAAKDGGIFPYGKEVPDDTSKRFDTVKVLKKNGDKVPVRPVRTFWDGFLTRSKQFSAEKRQSRRENFRVGRGLEDKVVVTWKDEEAGHNHGIINSPKRVTRRALASDDSRDSSSVNENIEIPSRWSEFPYSKAIPFDPKKLRLPRSSMEYLEPSGFVPQDFPYAEAIPYDYRKLLAFRRKKSGTQDEGMMEE